MTIDEAISHAREVASRMFDDRVHCIKCAEEHGQLAEWLEELQQYRQIGTVKECSEAVEKQTARKPDYKGDGYSDGQLVYDTWICPSCGKHYEVDYDRYDYCKNCGQKLDWRDEE